MQHKDRIPKILLTLIMLMSGCDNSAVQISREAADRQAQQNAEMAQVVETDAQARKDFVAVHHDLQAERAQLNTGWNKLEDERIEVAGQRRTESMLVSVTKLAGGGLLVAMVIGFCSLVLFSAHRDEPQADLHELVLREVLTEGLKLVSETSRPLISHADPILEERVS